LPLPVALFDMDGHLVCMEQQEQSLTIQDLARTLVAEERPQMADQEPDEDELRKAIRTIRYYMDLGLLPRPASPGKALAYHEEHRERLRLIRLLNRRGMTLKEMADQLRSLPLDDIRTLLKEEERRDKSLIRPPTFQSPKQYLGTLLDSAHASYHAVEQRAKESPSGAHSRRGTGEHHVESSPPRSWAVSDAHRAPTTGANDAVTIWRHVRLAPGVALEYTDDAYEKDKSLIDIILRMSGISQP